MSHLVLEDACIGCGGCEYACPEGALAKTDSYLGLFVINPLTCNDCGDCVPKCPVDAIVVDPDWAVCEGRGCPLGSARLGGVTCTVWTRRCASCGTTLWQAEGAVEATCPRCDEGRSVACPRTRRLDTITETVRATFPESFLAPQRTVTTAG